VSFVRHKTVAPGLSTHGDFRKQLQSAQVRGLLLDSKQIKKKNTKSSIKFFMTYDTNNNNSGWCYVQENKMD